MCFVPKLFRKKNPAFYTRINNYSKIGLVDKYLMDINLYYRLGANFDIFMRCIYLGKYLDKVIAIDILAN